MNKINEYSVCNSMQILLVHPSASLATFATDVTLATFLGMDMLSYNHFQVMKCKSQQNYHIAWCQ